MQSAKNLADNLGTLFAETFHIGAPSPETDLLEEGILDSFQFVELLVQIEKRFNLRIDIADMDLDDLRTLERLAGLVIRNAAVPESVPAELSVNVQT